MTKLILLTNSNDEKFYLNADKIITIQRSKRENDGASYLTYELDSNSAGIYVKETPDQIRDLVHRI